VAGEVAWYAEHSLDRTIECTAQVRAHGAPIPARATLQERAGALSLDVEFTRAEAGVAAGQAVVCYDEEERIIGGGWIAETR